MTEYSLRLYDDRLGAKATTADAFRATNRVLYTREGMVSVAGPAGAATMSTNSACFSSQEITVSGGPEGARFLRYELVNPAEAPALLDDEDSSSSLLLEAKVELEPGENYLMRCDRVDIPPRGIAYTHTHQGPGIRCLLEGGFSVETEGQKKRIAPGAAWFESGPDPVLASAPEDRPGNFSRVMILPRTLKGRSSISYVNPEDADKPKLQRYTIFIDEFISI
jgi:quercetin dioxygenase-like cupin family protein